MPMRLLQFFIIIVGTSEPENDKLVKDQLFPLWKKFLLNQFHDVIPGSCIEQVVLDAMEIYDGKGDRVIPIHNN